jgi:transcriptional regulator with GAF, ATPase, and Fis domain
VGNSPAIRAVLADAVEIAGTRCCALLEGESGTGKELIARIIHQLSCGHTAPFEAINCGAIPEPLLESELFGHVPGAFTGAMRRHRGVFERASHGTVFLDEITEMIPSAQVRLLRVLQDGAFHPVGGEQCCLSHARVVAATNRDLGKELRGGRFREDLFYRLNVFPIRIPPLRDRREDIPDLVAFFLDRFTREYGRPRPGLHPAALRRLMVYSYPGNVRELQNIVSALFIEARRAPEILDRHVMAVFSRHQLDYPPAHQPGNGEALGGSSIPGVAGVGAWVLEELRRYRFNISLAERMLVIRKGASDDRRAVPVYSRSGLTYYLHGEGFRALAAEGWNLEAAALRLAGDRQLLPRVRSGLQRSLAIALQATRSERSTPGQRLIFLRKAFVKMPRDYQEDLRRLYREIENGRWT